MIIHAFFPPATLSELRFDLKSNYVGQNFRIWRQTKNKLSVRQFSSLDNKGYEPFYEWLRGLTDAEGCFNFVNPKGQTYQFTFKILLHIDDIDTLHYIRDKLGIGSVKNYGYIAHYSVTKQKDIEIILKIFTDYPLISTKLLNFIEFKRAFELYTSCKNKTEDLSLEMEKIKSKMNRGRTDFQLPERHHPLVTSSWLLGFVEGEGSFFIDRSSNQLVFTIGLHGFDSALLEAIKNFFSNLPEASSLSKDCVRIYQSKGTNKDKAVHLRIKNRDFLKFVIIPFFSSMAWHSKKFWDFQDWVLLFKLKEKGHMYTDEGLRLIELICSQMNNNRLSTSKSVRVDRALLHADILRLLSGPSNFEQIGDKIYIKSLNKYYSSTKAKVVQLVDANSDEVINTFTSLTACAKSLGMAQSSLWVKYTKEESFYLKDKLVKIKREVLFND